MTIALLGASLACFLSGLPELRRDFLLVGFLLLLAALGVPVAVTVFALVLVIFYSLLGPWR